ncbi:MAG: hypothetical protein AAF943_08435 [Pseudomonadota bacterium]
MTPARSLLIAALIGLTLSLSFVATQPIPTLFPGSTFAIAGALAGLITLSVIAWMPDRWLWSDADRLAQAFRAHHGLTDRSTMNALAAIRDAHARAQTLRAAATAFHADLKPHVMAAADRLDVSAREIFYEPSRLSALRAILNRSELIEDATRAHQTVRARGTPDDPTVVQSRETLLGALKALEEAFVASDLRVARGHLEQVKVASSVAESLLTPRQPIERLKDGDLS